MPVTDAVATVWLNEEFSVDVSTYQLRGSFILFETVNGNTRIYGESAIDHLAVHDEDEE